MRAQYLSGLTNTAVLVVTGPIRVSNVDMWNSSNAKAFLQMFNASAAADVTVGTTVPVAVVGGATVTQIRANLGYSGIEFGLGLVVAWSTGETTSGAPNVNGIATLTIGN